ncbi:hypothetical protein [Sphingomonas oryzagri]
MDVYRMRETRTVEFARGLLAARDWRANMFPNLPLTDRCWAILLVLFAASADGTEVPVCDLMTYLADIPKSTILHNILRLVANGYVTRADHPLDGRLTLVILTEQGRDKVGMLLSRMMNMFTVRSG